MNTETLNYQGSEIYQYNHLIMSQERKEGISFFQSVLIRIIEIKH